MACNAPSLAASDSATFKLEATPPEVGVGGRYVKMAVAATAETDDPDPSNNSADASVFVLPPYADLSLGIQRTGVVTGSVANFRVPVTNAGPNQAVEASVLITSNLTGVQAATIAAPKGWVCKRTPSARMRIDCMRTSDMPVSATETITFSVLVPRNLSFYVYGYASSYTDDPDPSNNGDQYDKP
jgi:hypothetical protein